MHSRQRLGVVLQLADAQELCAQWLLVAERCTRAVNCVTVARPAEDPADGLPGEPCCVLLDQANRVMTQSLHRQQALAGEEKNSIQDLLKGIAKLSTDTKAKELRDQLKKAFADGFDTAIVFTQY